MLVTLPITVTFVGVDGKPILADQIGADGKIIPSPDKSGVAFTDDILAQAQLGPDGKPVLGPNGEILGADGKPLLGSNGELLGPDGKPLVGPNGELLGADGKPILGPNGEVLGNILHLIRSVAHPIRVILPRG